MRGIAFYFHLRIVLKHGDIIGSQNQYVFLKWLENGNLQFRINSTQEKSMPAEIIIAAAYARGRVVGNNQPIIINDEWVRKNGQDNWCFDEVLNHLLDTYFTI